MSELPTYPAGRRVAPSILSADFARLGEQVDEVLDAGAEVIHVDVMDGDFVPPITIGPLIVSAIADQVHAAGAVVDCHLMIRRPELQVDEFARAGRRFDHRARRGHASPRPGRRGDPRGGLPGRGRDQPGTPVIALGEVAGSCDLLLCMSVNPGWGGQSFIAGSPEKVRRIAALGSAAVIEIDGGIDAATAPLAAAAGTSWFVAGSAIFGTADPAAAYQEIAAAL